MNWQQYWSAVIIGSALHEAGHYAAACAFGLKVKRAGINWRGVYIVRESGTNTENILVSFCGPMVNLLLVLVAIRFDLETFGCVNFAVAVINLLPFLPSSDGARIMKNLKALRAEIRG